MISGLLDIWKLNLVVPLFHLVRIEAAEHRQDSATSTTGREVLDAVSLVCGDLHRSVPAASLRSPHTPSENLARVVLPEKIRFVGIDAVPF